LRFPSRSYVRKSNFSICKSSEKPRSLTRLGQDKKGTCVQLMGINW